MAKKQQNQNDELPDAVAAEANEDETVGTSNDARVAMLERINDQNDVEQAADLANVNDDGTTEPYEAPKLEANEETEDTTATETVAPVIVKHKIKVNGREVELTTEELISRAQKVEAADQYLVEAARIKRDAEQSVVVKQEQESHSQQEAVATQRLEERRALVRAIQMGTEEEAMAALEQLQSQSRQPQMTSEELARTVDERLTFKEAVSRFETQYQDILSDPVLRDLALKRDAELLAQGDKRDYWTRYKAVGDDLRTWRSGLLKTAQDAAPKSTPEKLERKAAAAHSVPRAAGLKNQPAPTEDDKEESASDVIAAIAKARGGPQWARA